MTPVEIPLKKRSLCGAYNPYRYIKHEFCKKFGKNPGDTFAASDGGLIYVFSGDDVFILDVARQNNT